KLNNEPGNLCWGTSKEDAADKARHGTLKHQPRKLEPCDVVGIRYWLTEGMTQTEIARLYGVSPAHVSDIAWGRAWADVTAVKSFGGKGEKHLQAKLNEPFVRYARELHYQRGYRIRDIYRAVEKSGIKENAVKRAITRQSWKHVK